MSSVTYLYLIEEVYGGCYKIGIAENPVKRAKSLQTGNPRPLTPKFTRAFESKREARIAELIAHQALKEFRVFGEWFSCDYETALRAVNETAQ